MTLRNRICIISSLLLFSSLPLSIAIADTLTFSGATDQTIEATSASGAVATFSVTAQDASSTSYTVTCSPSSGSTFTLGTSTVSCSAADSTGATSTTSFDIGVVDTTPPSITPPPTQFFATSTFPASFVLVPATAHDLIDPSPNITYSPTAFTVGTTTVTWTATDFSRNSAATSSLVVIADTFASTTSTSTGPTASSTLDVAVHVNVPSSCTATDTASVAHVYEATSSTSYLGICALEAALQSGAITSLGLSNQYPTLGLFITEIDGVAADPSSQYWALYLNGATSSLGITEMPVMASSTVVFALHDFSDNPTGDRVMLYIDSLIATSTISTTTPSGSGGGGGGGGVAHQTLNLASALAYLAAQQNADGSFSSDMLTDWVAIAYGSLSGQSAGSGASKDALIHYMRSANPSLSSVTDFERHAMALEDLGIDPYAGTGHNYITPIVSSFDGTQLGDPALDNDDIFGILALQSAGYAPSDPMMEKIATFILSRQLPDGSWDESPDMTSAALQVLPAFFVGTNVSPAALGQALGMGEGYLISTQQADGGWGNVDSTSWVQIFINAVNLDDPASARSWSSSAGYLPTDSIASAQATDGGVRPMTDPMSSRIWSTAYAIVAADGMDWDNMQQLFHIPAAPVVFGGGGGVSLAPDATTSTSTIATSTIATASSTTEIGSSTVALGTSTSPAALAHAATTTSLPTHPQTTTHRSGATLQSRANKKSDTLSGSLLEALSPSSASSKAQLAVASVSGGVFFGWVWYAAVSFFGSLFSIL